MLFYWTARGPYAVLWLRRFHRSEPHRFRFDRVLSTGSLGLFAPFTVQDSAFRTSYLLSFDMLLIFSLFSGLVMLLLVAIPLLSMLALMGHSNWDSAKYFLWSAASIILIGIAVWLGRRTVFRRGYVKLDPATAERMTLTLVEKAHRRRGPFLGVTILKCDDAFWQQVVAIAIEHSDAVIVDVSDLTENMAWELRTCLEKKAPRAVVLAYAAEGTTAPDTGALPGGAS